MGRYFSIFLRRKYRTLSHINICRKGQWKPLTSRIVLVFGTCGFSQGVGEPLGRWEMLKGLKKVTFSCRLIVLETSDLQLSKPSIQPFLPLSSTPPPAHAPKLGPLSPSELPSSPSFQPAEVFEGKSRDSSGSLGLARRPPTTKMSVSEGALGILNKL